MSAEDVVIGMKAINEVYDEREEAMDFFEGNASERLMWPPKIARMLARDGYGEAFNVNLCQKPVDSIVDRLKINSITVPSDDKATAMIEQVREALQLQVEENNYHRRTGEFGECFALVLPLEASDDPETVDDDSPGVEIYYNSPLNMTIVYDEERTTQKLFAFKRWQNHQKIWHARLYYANTIESWVTKSASEGMAEDDWEPELMEGVEDEWPIRTDFGQVPVFHFRTDIPYGCPDHKEAYGAQNAINKLIVSMMSTSDAASFPQRWALLEKDAALDTSSDDPDWDDDLDAGTPLTRQGGVSSSLRTDPGSIQLLEGVKETGTYQAADVAGYIDPIQMFIGLLATVTDTPIKEFKVAGQQPSADSQKEAKRSRDEKVRIRQVLYGTVWAELWKFTLKLLNTNVTGVRVDWAPPERDDDEESWQVTGLKEKQGVPQRQRLLERGYTTQQLDAWKIPE